MERLSVRPPHPGTRKAASGLRRAPAVLVARKLLEAASWASAAPVAEHGLLDGDLGPVLSSDKLPP